MPKTFWLNILQKHQNWEAPAATNPFRDPHVVPTVGMQGSLMSNGHYAYGGAFFRSDLDLGDVRPGNFNVATNRFTQHFIDLATSATGPWGPEGSNSPWEIITNRYMRVVSKFTNLSGDDTQDIRWNISSYLNPRMGNIEGILVVF